MKLTATEWYFFSFRDCKYATGSGTNRAAKTYGLLEGHEQGSRGAQHRWRTCRRHRQYAQDACFLPGQGSERLQVWLGHAQVLSRRPTFATKAMQLTAVAAVDQELEAKPEQWDNRRRGSLSERRPVTTYDSNTHGIKNPVLSLREYTKLRIYHLHKK